jgi:hypothetical protein
MDGSNMRSHPCPGVIGFGTLTIAYWQHKTAKNKLRLDLFDRRLPVFEAAMKLAGIIISKGNVSREEVREFAIASSNVRFLFDQKLQDYCDELHDTALIVWAVKQKIDALPLGEERATSSELLIERIVWFNEQLSNEIPKRFTPFLRILG